MGRRRGLEYDGTEIGYRPPGIYALPDGTKVGDKLEYLIEVTDPSRFDAFTMELTLDIVPSGGGGGGGGGKSTNKNNGQGLGGGAGSTFNLPNITTVSQPEWGTHDFDELSVLKVVHVGTPTDPQAPVYDFFVNVDNKFLLHSQKERLPAPNCCVSSSSTGSSLWV